MVTKITVNPLPKNALPTTPAPQASFVRRLLEVSVKLGGGGKTNTPSTFSESGTDTVTLSGLRTSARIQNSGAPSGASATIQVWGMSPSLMNQLATLGMVYNIVEKNELTLLAGDATAGMSPVFSGTVVAAYTQFDQAPDVACRFDCNSGLGASTAPAAATSYAGSTDVATIMSSFAKQMNVGFENNGVNVKLSAPYFWGNVREQVRDAAEAANVNAEVIEGKLCIWPKGGNRNTTTVPEIGAATGMIGYPAYTQNGMIVKTIFSPKISFGGLVHVTSTLFSAAAQSKSANASQVLPQDGNWAIYKIDHALDAFMPGGQWMSTVYGYNPKYPRPTVPGPVLS